MTHWVQKYCLALFAIFIFAGCHRSPNSQGRTTAIVPNQPYKTWVFFDLGNTLIDTSDFSHQRYMPNAQMYLKALRSHGFAIGLTLNIPESWGSTGIGKFAEIVRFIDGKRKNSAPHADWADSSEFDWNDFDDSGVLFPYFNTERKPGPTLFLRALSIASPCGALFQGEDDAEIQMANSVGLSTYKVGQPNQSFYAPIETIESLVKAKRTSANDALCQNHQN